MSIKIKKYKKAYKRRKLKNVFIIWLAIYPLITFILFISEPYLKNMVLPLKTLVLTIIVVPIMVFFAIPNVRKIIHIIFRGMKTRKGY